MGLTTNFNVNPYYDDFTTDKNFHKILFKPAVALQARELTQLQTILQNQIELFGNNILREGTIIKGGNFVEEAPLPYVKVKDNDTDGTPILISSLVGYTLVSVTTGLRGLIQITKAGLESQAPDLNTLYFYYLNTGTNENGSEQKVFLPDEFLEVRDTYNNLITTLVVAPATTSPVGNGYGVRCGDGVIFQKGHFIYFDAQLQIVSKYSNVPDGVVIGFTTRELIVNSDQDSSLLDNARGYNNENAPGADRLKLVPTLVTKTLAEAEADDTFFAIQEYANGRVIRRNIQTEFNSIAKFAEQRTAEIEGNITIRPFPLRVDNDNATIGNTQINQLRSLFIGAGLAYVEGKRVELLNEFDILFTQGTTTESVSQQNITINYGNYAVADTILGDFNSTQFDQIELYDSLQLSSSVRSTTNDPRGVALSDDDATVYILDGEAKQVSVYSSNTTANTITLTFNQNIELLVGNTIPNEIKFASNGDFAYIYGQNPTGIDTLHQFTLNTPYDLSDISTVFTTTNFVDNAVFSFEFNSSGNTAFFAGFDGNIYKYTLGFPYNFSTADAAFEIVREENLPSNNVFTSIKFGNSGNTVFLLDRSSLTVKAFDLNTPYDLVGNSIVSATPSSTLDLSDELGISTGNESNYPFGMEFNSTGDELYITNRVNDSIIRFDLANAWDLSNTVSISSYNLNNNDLDAITVRGNKVGTANLRNVTLQENGKFRFYLFNVKMDSGFKLNQVKAAINKSGANVIGLADFSLSNGSLSLVDTNFNRGVFETGKKAIKQFLFDGSNPIDYVHRKRETATIGALSNQINISLVASNIEFPYLGALNSDQIRDFIVVSNENDSSTVYKKGQAMAISAITVNSATSATITLTRTCDIETDVIVYFNVKRSGYGYSSKDLRTTYLRVDTSNTSVNAAGPFSLGLPDVYQIEQVLEYPANTANFDLANTELATDITTNFVLDSNQKDSYYGISYAKKKANYTIGTDGILIFKIKYFDISDNTGKQHYFTVDSYDPSDVTLDQIPIHTLSDGRELKLRDTIDFRPYADALITVAGTETISTPVDAHIAVATIKETFDDYVESYIPVPNDVFEASLEYYLGRIDLLIIDEFGKFKLIKGNPSENPIVPTKPEKGMALARMYVPPFPSFPQYIANRNNRPDRAILILKDNTKSPKKANLSDLERRVSRLEYYTSLNLLEKSTADLLITDANGLERFKNGILVDNFYNFASANVRDIDFEAAIDYSLNEAIPRIRQYPVKLVVDTVGTGAKNNDGVLTLDFTHKNIISQPYATRQKNLTTSFYKYTGTMILTPPYDTTPDVTRAPDVDFNVDLTSSFIDFADTLNEIIPIQTETIEVTQQATILRGGTQTLGGQTRFIPGSTIQVDTIENTTVTGLQISSGQQTLTQVGDFVRNVNFNYFMRSNDIHVFVSGLRPNTRFYFFFDGTDVNDNVVPTNENFVPNAAFGSAVTSNASGVIRAIFRIPAETFFVGDRTLEIMDVNLYNSKDAATSFAKTIYRGFNFNAEVSGATITTRQPEFENVNITTSEVVATTRLSVDPLSQTFTISPEHSSEGYLLLSKLNVYFAEKSSVNGLNVEIRETENGFPSRRVLPFGRKRLEPSQINTSANANTATEVVFDKPITLKTDTQYALVLKPDANDPDYLAWVSKVGENDVTRATPITQDHNTGTLFTSTNDYAWTPYQDENLKFDIFKAQFDTSVSANVSLTNNDDEFFIVENVTEPLIDRELVFVDDTATGNVEIESGNTTLTSDASFASIFRENDYIIVVSGSEKIPLKISSVNGTQLTVSDIPLVTNASAQYYRSPVGKVSYYYNVTNPIRLHLEESSARSIDNVVFEANTTIRGAVSGATATISEIVNQKISYTQLNVYKSLFNESALTPTLQLWDGSSLETISPINLNSNIYVKDNYTLPSKSNFPDDTVMRLNFNMATDSVDTSPIIDAEIGSMNIIEYIIDNDIDNNVGYVSKTVELKNDLEAEDLKVYVTAYRPQDTNIYVYAKFKSGEDQTPFDQLPWTPLVVETDGYALSSNLDRFDYKEFTYNLGEATETRAGVDSLGYFKYTAPDGSVYENYKFFAIKIVMKSPYHYRVPRIKDMRAIALT